MNKEDLMEEKKIKSRKRQIAVDTQGNLYQVLVHQASIHHSKGGAVLADIALIQHPQVKKMLVDLSYRGFFEEIVTQLYGRVHAVVRSGCGIF